METITKSITVNAPLSTVYNQYTQFEDFPQFMQGIKSVKQMDDTTLHWVADIAGKEVTWTAKITEQVPDKVIAWQSTSGRTNNGRVQFSASGADQTNLQVQMQYDPEGFIENVGDALGVVTARMEGDLQRFKHFIEKRGQETGSWRGEVHGGRETSTAGAMGSGTSGGSSMGSGAMGSGSTGSSTSGIGSSGSTAAGTSGTSGTKRGS